MTTVREIAGKIGIRQVSVFHFCTDFGIPISKYSKAAEFYPDTILQDDFINFLLEYSHFLTLYDVDYYNDKTPEYIANLLKKELSELDSHLRSKFPSYYTKGSFEAPRRYSLRYISSFKLDKDMGADYSHLTFPKKRDSHQHNIK